jgi:hypothetical protein
MGNVWKFFALSLVVTLALIGGLAWLASSMLVSPPLKRIMTAAFQMDLAEGWSCSQDGIAWTCVPDAPEEQKSAVAIFAMKYRNVDDTPEAFAEHLRSPQPIQMRDGSMRPSTVKYVKSSRIGGYDWVDSLHLGSEIGDYYTHYLATVTSHIAILVSFSAYKDDFDRYNPQLEQMISSLVIYQRPQQGWNTQQASGLASPRQ